MGGEEGFQLLRRGDQGLLGVLVLGCLAAIAGWFLVNGGHRGRLVDVEREYRSGILFQVDLNVASEVELALLPGIGPRLAERIVLSRQQEGQYREHQQLLRVHGIGPKRLAQIRPHLLPIESPDRRPGAPQVPGEVKSGFVTAP